MARRVSGLSINGNSQLCWKLQRACRSRKPKIRLHFPRKGVPLLLHHRVCTIDGPNEGNMDWLRKAYWCRACIMAVFAGALVFSQVGHAPAGPRSTAHDEALLWFGGKPVYVHDMTQLDYNRGLKLCRFAYRHEHVNGPALVPMVLPLDHWWEPSKSARNRAKSLYLQGLRGVLDDYVRYQVLEAFRRRYHPNLKKYVRLSRGASKPATKGRNSGVQNQPLVFCLITSNNLSCQCLC